MEVPKFIASYWTLAGDVVPLGNPDQEASSHGLTERVEVAAKAGYCGIGLMRSDLLKILRKHSYSEIKSILTDHEMRYLELEFLVGWMGDSDEHDESEVVLSDMLNAAERLGVRHLKVGPDMGAREWPMDRMIERFSGLCDRAKRVGTSISLELMPWSNIRDLKTAIAVVSGAGCKNGGILLDIWHIARGGIGHSEVSQIPAGLINYVEINDADKNVQGTLLEDTLDNRKFCGEGHLDLSGFFGALTVQGYKGPIGIEILSKVQRKRPFADVAHDAIRTARREFDKTQGV